MSNTRSGLAFAVIPAVVAAILVVSATEPAGAQRKSIRWATSSPDSYGYQVSAAMMKVLYEAFGGEYFITVSLTRRPSAP